MLLLFHTYCNLTFPALAESVHAHLRLADCYRTPPVSMEVDVWTRSYFKPTSDQHWPFWQHIPYYSQILKQIESNLIHDDTEAIMKRLVFFE